MTLKTEKRISSLVEAVIDSKALISIVHGKL